MLFDDATNTTQKLVIDSSGIDITDPNGALTTLRDGKVGIGTSSPGSMLEIIDKTGNVVVKNILMVKDSLSNQIVSLGTADPSHDSGAVYVHSNQANMGATISGNGNSYFKGGRVGIGTSTPRCPLEIVGNVSVGLSYVSYFDETGGGLYSTNTAQPYSIIVSDDIMCAALLIESDRRIKKNIVDVPDNLALEMLRSIPCRYYEYIDTITRGTEKTIGFIAQEVKEVFPIATNITKDFIPDIMQTLENVSWEQIIDSSNNQYKLTTDLQDVSGVKYRFYVSNDLSGNDETLKDVVGNSDNTFTFDEHWNNVFCYGQQVDDFNVLDKNKLFAINFSATQELSRLNDEKTEQIATMQEKIANLEARLLALESK